MSSITTITAASEVHRASENPEVVNIVQPSISRLIVCTLFRMLTLTI